VLNGVVSNSDLHGEAIKLLLADDSTVIRRGICRLLAGESHIEVVGEATNFAQTIQLANNLKPRVVVMDLHMPDERQITPQHVRSNLSPMSRLLAMSLWNDDETATLARSFGAAALLDKSNLATTLIPTIVKLAL
jgi:two-component system, NarL family, response regulator NreC